MWSASKTHMPGWRIDQSAVAELGLGYRVQLPCSRRLVLRHVQRWVVLDMEGMNMRSAAEATSRASSVSGSFSMNRRRTPAVPLPAGVGSRPHTYRDG